MKKYFILICTCLFFFLFLCSCKNPAENKSEEIIIPNKNIQAVAPIKSGASKVIVGKNPPHSVDSQPDTQGCFPEGRTVMLYSYEIAKHEVTYELWYNVRIKAEKELGYIFLNKGMQGSETGGGSYPDYRNIGKKPTAPSKTLSDDTDAVNYLHPVTMVSWRDAVVWCNAYSEISGLEPVYYYEGKVLKDSSKHKGLAIFNYYECDACEIKKDKNGYRLPTEAEWEFAARGGNPFSAEIWNYKYAGSNTLDNVGWMEGNSKERTHEAGKKSPNTLGLFDMTGNIDEWCSDIYSEDVSSSDSDYKISGIVTNPAGKILKNPVNEDYNAIKRIYKGGKFEASNDYGVVTLRKHLEPRTINNGLGFRICRTLK